MAESLKLLSPRETTIKAVGNFFNAVPKEACSEYRIGQPTIGAKIPGIGHRKTLTDTVTLPTGDGWQVTVRKKTQTTSVLGRQLKPKQSYEVIKSWDEGSNMTPPNNLEFTYRSFDNDQTGVLHTSTVFIPARGSTPKDRTPTIFRDIQSSDARFAIEMEVIQNDLQAALEVAQASAAAF